MFPPEAYTQGERFQLEKRRLFATAWLPLCAAGQLAAPGAFVNHSIGGWPIFAIRGADSVARAFRNVCRHQGMPVVEKPSGQCDVLRCRYHGWTYDLTGALASAPPLVAPEDPAAPMHHLDALALVEAGGMIQARGRGGGDDSAPEFGLGDHAFAGASTIDIDANWKAVVEALLVAPAWRFVWPLAFVEVAAPVVRQIVPRSFSRTRLIDLRFGDAAAPASDIKTAAEAIQADRAAGAARDKVPAVQEFHRRLSARCD